METAVVLYTSGIVHVVENDAILRLPDIQGPKNISLRPLILPSALHVLH